MNVPTASQIANGALFAVDNAAQILEAANVASTHSPTVGAFLTAAAKEELGKARLLLEYFDSTRTQNAPSACDWQHLGRKIRNDHRAKLRAFARWENELGHSPDPCEYCDLEEPDCDACASTNHNQAEQADLSAFQRQLALSCIYVDWDAKSGGWSTPSPVAGSYVTMRHLLGVMDAYRDDVMRRTGRAEGESGSASL